jgi:uncharacterized protein YndB with AHSA1/START domain
METLHFETIIDADREKVWQTMLDDQTYREWTKAFSPGSYYEGNWEQGSEIRFLGPNAEGKQEGMISRIKENRKYEFVSIEHLGMISGDVIDTTSEEVKKWAPSFENYTLSDSDSKTLLKVDMQINAEYIPMFEKMWPKALEALKILSEQ